ncbi:hypothetical protein BRC79_10220 [Halobacteriales archaeon QH_8_67_27]|nr:MAG: hypothetical protein BRC79_10220 [Halobacteriales archaeon QH_8_67_27]
MEDVVAVGSPLDPEFAEAGGEVVHHVRHLLVGQRCELAVGCVRERHTGQRPVVDPSLVPLGRAIRVSRSAVLEHTRQRRLLQHGVVEPPFVVD